MKKLLIILLACVLMLSMFVACNTEETPTENPTGETPSEETPSGGAPEIEDENLEAALAFAHELHKSIPEKTGAAYTLGTKITVGEINFTAVWTVSSELITVTPVEGEDKVTVTVPEDATEDIPYTLTVTIKNEAGEEASRSYDHIVPKFEYASFADYAATKAGEPVVVKGIITGITSKATGSNTDALYLQDINNEGGYYIYGVSAGFEGLAVGMTVEAKGTMDIYNGTLEVKSATVKILDETITPVTPVDFTTLLANATSLSDEALVVPQGMLVTIKGVTIGEAGDNGYYYFQAGAHKVYLRISSSANPCTTADLDAIKAVHAANFGNTADVTGVISVYNGNFYLSPVSAEAFSNIVAVEKTPAEMVAIEKDALTLPAKITTATTLTLPTVGNRYAEDVTFTWTMDGVAVENPAIELTPVVGETKEIVFVATITCGEVTDTKEIKVTLSADPISIKEVIASEDGTAVIVEGIVCEIADKDVWSDQYNNMSFTIRDGEGNTLYIFRCTTKVELGDAVRITGTVGSYNGAKQIAKNNTAVITGHYTEMSITEAIAAEDGTLVVVKGTVSEIADKDAWSDKYQNMSFTITDAEGNTLYIYRCGTKVVVGDVVTITGTVGSYKEAKQIAQGSKAIVEKAEGGEGEGGEEGGNAGNPELGTLAAALTFADTANRTTLTADQQVWTYGNVVFTNAKGASKTDVTNYDQKTAIRCYQNSNIQIDCTGMKVVVFHCNDYKADYANTLAALTIEGATVTANGNDVTITFTNAVNTLLIENLAKQVRIDSIDVYTA